MMVWDLVQVAPVMPELDRVPAAFRSRTWKASVTPTLHRRVVDVSVAALWYTSNASAMRVSDRSLCVPSGLMCLRERAITGTHWTDCHAESRARRVSRTNR